MCIRLKRVASEIYNHCRHEKEIQIHVNQADPDSKVLCLQCCMCDQQFRHMCIFMKVK